MTFAESGVKALELMETNRFNVVVSDMRMPGMNGFELYDKIKKLDNKVKVCLISAYDVDYDALREQFPSLEIDCLLPRGVIRKPIQVAKLIERIELELLT